MNGYILLPQKNVKINDIPPRLMWNDDQNSWMSTSSGYCGETSILSAGLLHGQYVPMYLIRELLVDYFIDLMNAENPPVSYQQMWLNYTGSNWTDQYNPGYDFPNSGSQTIQEWFKANGQYYCQVLPQIGDNSGSATCGFPPINSVLQALNLNYKHYAVEKQHTYDNFIPWLKQNVVDGNPVIIGLQDFVAGSNDINFDHIVIVIGWGSNQPLTTSTFFPDDEIVFSDHGLVVGSRQPIGGSIPYYFKYTMHIPTTMPTSGGWLPDGGCQDPTNPAWSFIQNLGEKREISFTDKYGNQDKVPCNTYQLAQADSGNSAMHAEGNAGFAILGLNPATINSVPVRIDTDGYYQIPCITSEQAKSGVMPTGQMINHRISVSALDPTKTYHLWLYKATNSQEVINVPTSGYASNGQSIGTAPIVITNQENYIHNLQLTADVALFARCVEA